MTPENVRTGAPYDNPEFERLARELGVWGTAQSSVCAQFWMAAHRAGTFLAEYSTYSTANVPEKSSIGAACSVFGTPSGEDESKSVPSTPLSLRGAAQYALDWLAGEELNMAHDVVHHLQAALASTEPCELPDDLIDDLAARHGLDSFVYMPFSRDLERAVREQVRCHE